MHLVTKSLYLRGLLRLLSERLRLSWPLCSGKVSSLVTETFHLNRGGGFTPSPPRTTGGCIAPCGVFKHLLAGRCSFRQIRTLSFRWFIQPIRTSISAVLPKPVSVHNLRLCLRATLNPVHNIIQAFYDNIRPFPSPAQLSRFAFLGSRVVQAHKSALPESKNFTADVVSSLHSFIPASWWSRAKS